MTKYFQNCGWPNRGTRWGACASGDGFTGRLSGWKFLFSGEGLAEADWEQSNQRKGGFGAGLSQGSPLFESLSIIVQSFFTLSCWHVGMACYHILKVRAAMEKAIEAANSKAVSRANKVLVDNNLDSSDQAGDDIIPEILGSKVCLAFFWLQHLFWGIDTNIEGHFYCEMKTFDCSLEFRT